MIIEDYLKERRLIIEEQLQKMLSPSDTYPESIYHAISHSLFAGGKRLRPILVLAVYELFDDNMENAYYTACALEFIHTYSLIHDDLPAMDNDDYRRGVPTCHKLFGEALAILAGDALLTHAFFLLAENAKLEFIGPEKAIRVISEISSACGLSGLIGGQVVDIESENKEVDPETLYYIHRNKTGALIKAAIRSGAILAGANERELEALTNYGEKLGLAFQIVDDILDIEGDEKQLGKATGSDLKQNKVTFPLLFGMEESKKIAREAIEKAQRSLDIFGEKAQVLREIASYVITRTY